jgi:two-component system cell cycle sensor histidine kinase/response regulator CckA
LVAYTEFVPADRKAKRYSPGWSKYHMNELPNTDIFQEREIAKSFEDLLNSIDGIVWEANAETFDFKFVSKKAETLLGFPVGNWYEKDFWANQIHPDDRERAVSFCVAATARGEDHQFEYRMICADGSIIWLKDLVTHVVADDGTKLLRGVMLDITDQKRTESELNATQERLGATLKNTPNVAVQWYDENGVVKYWNPASEKMFGWSADEAVGKTLDKTIHTPEEAEQFRLNLRSIHETGKPIGPAEYQFHRRDGSSGTCSSTTFEIPGENGQPYFVCMDVDVTDRKNLEEQLFQSQKMEAIGQLAGGVAHDFNNLLTAIIGYSDLILRKLPPDDPVTKHVGEIRRSGNRAAALTRQLLAFSRKQIMQPRLFDLNLIVNEIEQMLRLLIGENIDLTVTTDPLLGAVMADPGQIEQVILNLAVNAKDAMSDGGLLELSTSNVTLGESTAMAVGLPEGDYVCLTVKDSGTGIEADLIDHIFEPFFTTKETGKGTGLGLSTVYGIVRQSGGQASVESEPGKGTTFRIFLPRILRENVNDFDIVRQSTDSAGTETILLVEDEQMVRELVENVLRQNGYTVIAASDGAEAIAIADSGASSIDLMITDVIMPGMNGLELAARFTAMQPNLKVLYISGYTENAELSYDATGTGDNFVQKPFLPDELKAKVRAVLDGKTAPIHISA